MLTALSIQLALYATAWFLMGLAFALNRQAVFSWSFAWGILALTTALLANPQWPFASTALFAMNTLLVLAFTVLMWGCGKAYQQPVASLHLWGPIAGAIMIDVLRAYWPAETTSLRQVAFVVCVGWPIAQSVLRLMAAIKHIGFSHLSVLVWLPGLLVVYFFSLRAYWLTDNVIPSTQNFTGQSMLDQVAISLFLISLGSFNFAQAAFVIGRLVRRLRELSDTDQLTHLANRRTLMRQLAVEDARFHRSGHHYAVLMLDLDHFKRLNDTHGHQAGDMALKSVSAIVKNEIRANDTLARYGGEEFLVLMPETTLQAAQTLGNRIRERIASVPITVGAQTVSVTTSVGVALSAVGEVSFEHVIKRADDALYKAKHHGRNCVIVSA